MNPKIKLNIKKAFKDAIKEKVQSDIASKKENEIDIKKMDKAIDTFVNSCTDFLSKASTKYGNERVLKNNVINGLEEIFKAKS